MSALVHSGFFVLRTPLDPLEAWLEWSEGVAAPAALGDPARLERALAEDRVRLRARLAARIGRPEVREALFLASPGLEATLDLWVRDPESERGREVERALVRYAARMAGRATPFGLFAGWQLGAIADVTMLRVAQRDLGRRHTRLDMDYLVALTDALARDPALAPALRVRPNSSLHHGAGRLRYVEIRHADLERTYHLVAVEDDEPLRGTLARATGGASRAVLAAALTADDVTPEEAAEYIEALVANQVLVPELACPLTGPEPLHALITALRAAAPAAAGVLDGVRAELDAMDQRGLGVPPAHYRAVAELLRPLPARVEISRLFQVDLAWSAAGATLGGAVLDEIAAGAELLSRLARPHHDDPLVRFREAFTARYEGRTVPLLEALDDEIGVGAALGEATESSPILRNLEFPAMPDEQAPWSGREALLLTRLAEALAGGRHEISLMPADLPHLSHASPLPLPSAFAVMATVDAESSEAVARGAFRVVLDGVLGPSGGRLLGRFCHGHPDLTAAVMTHLRAEEALDDDAVFAEVVHLPAARLGNILLRPVLRHWEIEYLGRSGASLERQLPASDLMVSVADGRIVLRSERLGRRVIPRLTTAHNFTWTSLPVYRFLCLLQSEGMAGALAWDWGVLDAAPFLPRVTAGRLVLARARWRASADELAGLTRLTGAARFRAVQHWRTTRGLPRRVTLAEGEDRLPIDLDNVLSVDAWLHAVKNRGDAVLVEMLPGPDRLCAEGPDGRFVHELVVPFVQHRGTAPVRPAVPSRVSRRFPPGSDWLYAKCYMGASVADEALREMIRPVVRAAIETDAADRWFFIRYTDPDFHLRVRLHGDRTRLQAEVVPALERAAAPLIDDGRCWRLAFDTYEREVERYGGDEGIVLAEQIFHADSEAVLEMLDLLEPGDAGTDERWRLTLVGVHTLLDDLGLDLAAKSALIAERRASFALEHRVDRELERALGDTYASERASLERLLASGVDGDHPLRPGLEALARRSRAVRPVADQLRELAKAGRLSAPIHALAASYVHMHANRLLRSSARRQELVLYDFLARLYASLTARAGGRPTPRRPRGRQ